MTTQKKNLVFMALLGLTAAALFLFATVDEAEAAVRVRARVETPIGVIRIANTPSVRYRELPPLTRHVQVRLTAQDRRIAKRLARYTGAEKQELLNLKRRGYTWVQIGRWLDLSPRAVRAAYELRTWQRFLDQRPVVVRCGTGSRHDGCCDDRHDDHRGRGRGHDRH